MMTEMTEQEDRSLGLTLLIDEDIESDESLLDSEDSDEDVVEGMVKIVGNTSTGEEKVVDGNNVTTKLEVTRIRRKVAGIMPSKKYHVVVLVSGGKDSLFNAMECVSRGHELVAFANIAPDRSADHDDLSSFMYQTVGHELIDAIATCAELPLIRRHTKCHAKTKSIRYENTSGDEVEDLYELLVDVKKKYPQVDAVSVGAIFSDYQRNRVENVCSRLNLVPLCFMWRREQRALLREMILKQMECVVVKVACLGLNRTHVGKTIRDIESHLLELNKKYGVHPCGEGGEYETLTLNCPLFKRKRIVLDRVRVLTHSDDEDVISMRVEEFHLEEKKNVNISVVNERDVYVPLLRSLNDELLGKVKNHSNNMEEMEKKKIVHVELTNVSSQKYDSVYDETIAVMRELKRKLETKQCKLEDTIHVRLYVLQMSDFGEINRAFCEMFGGKTAKYVPARSCVQILQAFRVAASCVAIVKEEQTFCRSMLWVRSISSWAPTNIGPYCQANTFKIAKDMSITYLAGQIGLDPSTMQLVSKLGGWGSELIQCVSNCKAVLNVVYKDTPSFHVMRCVAYVSWKQCGLTDDSCPCDEISISVRAMSRGLFSDSSLPVSVIPVPRLPRDAAIELELIATASCQNVFWKNDYVSLEGSFVQGHSLVASITFSCKSCDNGPIELSSSFHEIIESIIFGKAQLDESSCINLHAYVTLGGDDMIMSSHHLRKEIKRSFRDKNISQIKLSIVPVPCLSTSSEFLHVCMESHSCTE